ncbi:MAG: hypothetical protein ABSC64_07655 [Candidatus Korobacteraceae bacterium]
MIFDDGNAPRQSPRLSRANSPDKFLDVAVRGQWLGTNGQDYQQAEESRASILRGTPGAPSDKNEGVVNRGGHSLRGSMRLEKASPLVYSYQSTRPDAENQLPKNASRSCRKLKKQIVFGLDPPIMPTTLSFADFSMSRAASELRYDNAYLIYDRTGQVIQEARGHFTNFKVTSATPNESTFLSDEGSFGLQLGSCRFISDKADASLESFGSSCKRYFDIVAELLDIRMFTRVGLRVITKKTTKDKEEAKALLREALSC